MGMVREFGRNGSQMTDEEYSQNETQLSFGGVGQKLRDAREQAGFDLAQVAAETRIPVRHLKAIEGGDFAALPARTYAVGFSRSYARMVGLDERKVAAEVREELASSFGRGTERPDTLEPGDPARVPSRGLVWASALAVVLMVVGGFAFFRSYIAPGSGPGPLIEQERLAAQAQPAGEGQAQAPKTPAAPTANPDGQVVFTALEDGVWVKFYDGSGKRLLEKQMARSEAFAVPADAVGPRIWTGRPDAFAITIGGNRVPKLAENEGVIRDVAIDARSLLARAGMPQSAATRVPGPKAVDNSAT